MTRAATLGHSENYAVDESDDDQVVACCQGLSDVIEQDERLGPGELQLVRLSPVHRRDDEAGEKRHQEENRRQNDGGHSDDHTTSVLHLRNLLASVEPPGQRNHDDL